MDFNVPLKNGHVQDQYRIECSVPTIKYCLKHGASVILCSHLGRPNGKIVEEMSLVPVGETLADLLEMPIKFSLDCISKDSHDVTLGLKPGEVHLLENLRFHKGETENDPARLAIGLAATLISGGAGYVVHSSAGVRGFEGYWNVVTPDILTALKATMDLLPAGIPNGERCNHHWPCHPYESDEQIWPDTDGRGVVRAFAANLDGRSYVAVMGM